MKQSTGAKLVGASVQPGNFVYQKAYRITGAIVRTRGVLEDNSSALPGGLHVRSLTNQADTLGVKDDDVVVARPVIVAIAKTFAERVLALPRAAADSGLAESATNLRDDDEYLEARGLFEPQDLELRSIFNSVTAGGDPAVKAIAFAAIFSEELSIR